MGELAGLRRKKCPTTGSILLNRLLVCSNMILGCASTNVACFVGMQDDAFLLHNEDNNSLCSRS